MDNAEPLTCIFSVYIKTEKFEITMRVFCGNQQETYFKMSLNTLGNIVCVIWSLNRTFHAVCDLTIHPGLVLRSSCLPERWA